MREYVEQTWSWDEKWQRAHFRENFDPAKNQIVVLDDRDIGVIAAERREAEVFLGSIYILPEYQRRGIGTLLIKSVLDGAFQEGLYSPRRAGCDGIPVSLSKSHRTAVVRARFTHTERGILRVHQDAESDNIRDAAVL